MCKADITADLVSRLIADQFPQWAGLPLRSVEADGVDNTTFRLGQTMSVRLPSAEVYAEPVDKEHRWLPVLARQLPLPIPEPLAKGVPGHGFSRPWSVYRWIDGDPATAEGITDMPKFAADLADFLVALYQIDPAGGPGPGTHNFFRGGAVKERLPFDEATWARGRGWAIWKAMIVLVEALTNDPEDAAYTKGIIEAILTDHLAAR